jgi:hypothetical protein
MPGIEDLTTFQDAQLIAEEHDVYVQRDTPQTFDHCNGKNCYPTRFAAEDMLRRRRGKGWNNLRIYQCPDCKNYHLTSN